MSEPAALPFGIGATEALMTERLRDTLTQHADEAEVITAPIDEAEIDERFARHVGDIVAARLAALKNSDQQVALVARLMQALNSDADAPVSPPTEVIGLLPPSGLFDQTTALTRPQTPLNDAALLTNATHDPSLSSELKAEIATADRIDLLCAFVKWHGLRLLEDELRAFRERGGRLRVITTTYIGATERRAIDRLIKDFGAEVKVQYDIERTRLHAKSWYFHRNTGWDTAYVGSSNLSKVALLEGVEWNVRLSKQQTGALLDKFRHTFEAYWADSSYQDYDPERDAGRLDEALVLASGGHRDREAYTEIAGIDVRPYPHQSQILEKLRVEREIHDRHRNLVVAATGTGKTVLAVLDYRDGMLPGQPTKSLLFVAHRMELLEQARRTFRTVMKDGTFGELLGDGQRPQRWTHVFATVQSLSRMLHEVDPDKFDAVIVDEFHHAEAASYRRMLEHLQPKELLGLTATPERTDGTDVRKYFGGRAAAEIRLWDALKADLLTPFHYFAISDNTDLSEFTWTRGAYSVADLEELYVDNDARVGLIIDQLQDKVLDPRRMKALGFCVSVAHAQYMTRAFTEAGLPALAVTGDTPDQIRRSALAKLAAGEVCTIFTVDLFNEGIDLPQIDTVLFLRPTESATIFIQQLGRGLRKAKDKAVLTALDFVGLQRKEFHFEKKYRALSGTTRKGLREGIENGFSYLPPGTEISLDRTSQEAILDNLKQQLKPKWATVVRELRNLSGSTQDVSLASYLGETGYELSDVLRGREQNWTALRSAAGHIIPACGPRHRDIIGRARALAHVDDTDRLRIYRQILSGQVHSVSELDDADQVRAAMLLFSIWPSGGGMSTLDEMIEALHAEPAACAEFLEILDIASEDIAYVSQPLAGRLSSQVLKTHARYTREEIAIGMRYAGFSRRPDSLREGVFYSDALASDVFLVTLKKNEKNYSPTTMYNDHAVSPEIFHWESQSTTSVDSPVGQRYIHHRDMDSEVLLFVREEKMSDLKLAAPYVCLGTADYLRHEGSRPIEFDWHLRTPMPTDLYARASME